MLGVISGQSSAIYCKAINEKSYRDFINVDSKKRIYVLCMTHMFKVKRPSYEACGTPVGKQRANQLANREPLSRDTIARMASFKRHQQHKDVPYSEGCGGLMWDCWGGTSGVEWAINKLEKLSLSEEDSEALAVLNEILNKLKDE